MDRKYTWLSVGENPNLAKLDRIFVFPNGKLIFPSNNTIMSSIDFIPCPLETRVFDRRQRRAFRFEKMWLKADDIDNVIVNSWSMPIGARDATCNISRNLKD